MLQYQYRWIYVLITNAIIIMIGFFYAIKPNLNELTAFKKEENTLMQQVTMIKKMVMSTRADRNTKVIFDHKMKSTDLISDLLMLAHLNGLQIQAVNLLPEKLIGSTEKIGIKLAISGEFQQLYSFVFALIRSPSSIQISNFNYKLSEQNQLLLALDILSWKSEQALLFEGDDKPYDVNNPFCAAVHKSGIAPITGWATTQNTSLNQMKMTGYFQQNQHREAFILLPNNTTIAIKAGDRIGKERGDVLEIEKDHVLVTQKEGKKWILKM